MTGPLRIQLRRTKGWSMPPNTAIADRRTIWGNPFRILRGRKPREFEIVRTVHDGTPRPGVPVQRHNGEHIGYATGRRAAMAIAVERHRRYLLSPEAVLLRRRAAMDLGGRNIGCWCRLCLRHANGKPFGEACPDCDPCHVDVLGELANGGPAGA